jgi:hypothetical protein
MSRTTSKARSSSPCLRNVAAVSASDATVAIRSSMAWMQAVLPCRFLLRVFLAFAISVSLSSDPYTNACGRPEGKSKLSNRFAKIGDLRPSRAKDLLRRGAAGARGATMPTWPKAWRKGAINRAVLEMPSRLH